MAITRIGTETLDVDTDTGTKAHSFSHTVPASCDLLIVSLGVGAHRTISGTPTWDGNNLTLISSTTRSGNSDDCQVLIYGLISPSAATGTLAVTFSANCPCSWVACSNWAGNATSNVAAATNPLTESVNDTPTTTSVHASGGSSGNALLFVGTAIGADMTPASNGSSFTEIHDSDTGGGENNNQDQGINVAVLLDAAPSAIIVTWGNSDENASRLIEIVIAPVGGARSQGPFGHPFHGPLGGPV